MWPVLFFRICLLRANPQDLPVSTALMLAALAAHFAADAVSAEAGLAFASVLQASAAQTLLLAALTHTGLMLRHREARVRQTLTALAGCGALLTLLAWGAVTALGALLPAQYLWAPFLLWFLAVYGHILRHAFDMPLAYGVLAALAYLLLSIAVAGAFQVPAAAEA
jgi:hypothetical protein